jgi:3D (Asp-Asp-Asp) domain-containing protein
MNYKIPSNAIHPSATKERRMLTYFSALVLFILTTGQAEGAKFVATAYTKDCAGCSGVTKSGIVADPWSKKIMAVDPRVLKLGKCYLLKFPDGHSTVYLAADTGGSIKGNRVDLLLKSKASAKKFGKQTVTITPSKCVN